jgi:hypothetical protein
VKWQCGINVIAIASGKYNDDVADCHLHNISICILQVEFSPIESASSPRGWWSSSETLEMSQGSARRRVSPSRGIVVHVHMPNPP